MKIWQVALGTTAAAFVVAIPAIAQMTAPTPQTRATVEARVKDRLGQFDTNKDGTVSRDEMRASAETRMKARRDERFTAMDTDKNGSISRAEYDAGAVVGQGRGDSFVHVERIGKGGDRDAQRGRGGRGNWDDRDVTVMTGNQGIVIADVVKKSLERFDATDTNRDGTISADERRAAREARRAKRTTAG